jgi:hypothetical protein
MMPDEYSEEKRKGIYHKDGGTTARVTGATKERYGTTAGKNLGAAGKAAPGMPKQSDYATTAEWAAAMREYRANQAKDPQKAAIRDLAGGGAKR